MTMVATGSYASGLTQKISDARLRAEMGVVTLGYSRNMNGRDKTHYSVIVGPDDFANLALAMMNANPQAAIKAFGAALQAGPTKNREVWYPGIDD